jgi:peroxiredoxin
MDQRNRVCKVLNASLDPPLLATAALLVGVPSYLLLEQWASSSPALLDRPWPLWVAEAALALIAAGVALRAGKGARRRAALGALAMALASGTAVAAVATRGLPEASPEVRVGQLLPDLRLSDELGRPVSLASLRGHPTVLIFYRGALCVACRAQLSALAEHAGTYIAQGVRIFGVSADPPAVSAEWKRELGLPFSLLSDQNQALAQSVCSARVHCVALVDSQGRIRWGALNDYWRGAQPAETVLRAAYRLGGN